MNSSPARGTFCRSEYSTYHRSFSRNLARESDYLIRFRDIADDALRKRGVELVGVFCCQSLADFLLGVLERSSARISLSGLIHQIAEILFPQLEFLFPVHDVAVSPDHLIEVEFFGGIQGLNPVIGVAVAHVGSPAVQSVARDENFLVRKENEHVAIGVRIPQPEKFHGS